MTAHATHAQSGLKPVTEHLINWELSERAQRDFGDLRTQLGPGQYDEERKSLRAHLVAYFKLGICQDSSVGITPVGGGHGGAKRLKVRWALQSRGKSRGLRIPVSVYCDQMRVRLHAVFERADEPSSAEYEAAFKA